MRVFFLLLVFLVSISYAEDEIGMGDLDAEPVYGGVLVDKKEYTVVSS